MKGLTFLNATTATRKMVVALWLGLVVFAPPASATKSWKDVEAGTLFLSFLSTDKLQQDNLPTKKSRDGHVRDESGGASTKWVAPTLDTDVNFTVTGPIARVVVKQRFHNPSNKWAEAVYLFPLPETAAVDQMRLRVGERIIEGHIKEKAQAKKIYRAAKRAGKRSSLVEQERPNLFTTSVANIPPGESISVEIEYQQLVDRQGEEYRLRYPMTVTPRYVPGQRFGQVGRNETPARRPANDTLDDAERITPPWAMQGENHNPTRIRVVLNPGFVLGAVGSLSHHVRTEAPTPLQHVVHLDSSPDSGAQFANSDFVLSWRPAGNSVSPGRFFYRAFFYQKFQKW